MKGVRQPQHIAGLAYGDADDKQWGKPARRVDFYDVKGDLERLAAPMKLRFVKEAFPALHPGRSAAVYLGSKRIGFIGELHPKAAQAYELPHAPVVFEVEVPALLDRPLPNYVPVSKFQSVTRDLAVVVPAEMEVEKLFDAVAAAKKKIFVWRRSPTSSSLTSTVRRTQWIQLLRSHSLSPLNFRAVPKKRSPTNKLTALCERFSKRSRAWGRICARD